MNTTLDEQKVNIRIKLAALWTSFMFLYIYVDYFHLYMSGSLQDILSGKVYTFDITQTFLTTALISITIPALMIFASVGLSAKLSRSLNIIFGALYIPYSLVNLAGEAWVHMYIGAAVEVALMVLVIRAARNWPKLQK